MERGETLGQPRTPVCYKPTGRRTHEEIDVESKNAQTRDEGEGRVDPKCGCVRV